MNCHCKNNNEAQIHHGSSTDSNSIENTMETYSYICGNPDFMIIASGNSSRHIQALSEILVNELKKKGIKNCRLEGKDSNDWKLIDAIDIIIHIFHPDKRKFYDLESMWSELIPKERLTI